jgi:hypothetical protein
VASFKIGFNEGSLLRRTLLHVGTFVVGAVAFIGLMSFVLVSIARGLVAPRTETATDDEPAAVASATPGSPKVAKPPVARPGRGGKRLPSAAIGTGAQPGKDE